MTNRELLAKAFPLHFQRICEAAYAEDARSYNPGRTDEFLNQEGCCAFGALMDAMTFFRTEEGHDYWMALAWGAKE